MQDNSIIYKTNTATAKEISTHLTACNDNFVPALNSRIDIETYADKLFEKAISFEAWDAGVLIGLVAAYFTDTANGVAFITNVSLLPRFMHRGIAAKLLRNCIGQARENNFTTIHLEVNSKSAPAIALYKKFDFRQYDTREDQLLMKLELNK